MNLTLQDIKDKIEELENSLPHDMSLEDIPLQKDISTNYEDFDIEIFDYLGYYYASIEIS